MPQVVTLVKLGVATVFAAAVVQKLASWPAFQSYIASSFSWSPGRADTLAAAILVCEALVAGAYAAWLLAGRSPLIAKLATVSGAGLATAFICFHVAMLAIGDIRPCGCLSTIVNWSGAWMHVAMVVISSAILAGAAFVFRVSTGSSENTKGAST